MLCDKKCTTFYIAQIKFISTFNSTNYEECVLTENTVDTIEKYNSMKSMISKNLATDKLGICLKARLVCVKYLFQKLFSLEQDD